MATPLRLVKRVVYDLKKRFPHPIDVYDRQTTIDLDTGLKTVIRRKFHVEKAIVLPTAKLANKPSRAETYRPFRYGSLVDIDQSDVIIDDKDIHEYTKEGPIDPGRCYLIFDHERFQIAKATNYYGAWYIVLEVAEDTQVAEILEYRAQSPLYINHQAFYNVVRNISVNHQLDFQSSVVRNI